MSALDSILWRRYRERNNPPFVRVYFDVAVGSGVDTGSETDSKLRATWARLTRQRIDVVGEGIDGWTIIEIRAAAGPGAIGSLLSYRELWKSDPPDSRAVDLWLITDIFPETLRGPLASIGAQLIVV